MFYEEKCILCGDCLSKCYYLDYSEEQAKQEFEKLINGEDSPVTRNCVTCARCNDICPEGANPFDLINLRQEETGTYILNEELIQDYINWTKMPTKIIKGDPDKPIMGTSIFNVPFLPGIFEGQLFEGLTLVGGEDFFSWMGFVHIGKPSSVNKQRIQNLVDKYTELSVDEILFYHEECYAAMNYWAKEYNIEVPFKTVHPFEYYQDYVKEHSYQVKKLNMKIAYHPPCSSRYVSGKDKVLDELFELIGVERVKRKYDREGALCCGTTLVSMKNVSQKEEIQWKMKTIMDAKEAGADAFVILCPMCAINLRKLAYEQGMEPYLLSNLVRIALGEELSHGGAAKTLH